MLKIAGIVNTANLGIFAMDNLKSGYTIGAWRRIFKKYPYETLPVGAYLIFEDKITGLKCLAAANRWAKRHGARFKSKCNSKGAVYIKRMN